jgi:hypothetical protein
MFIGLNNKKQEKFSGTIDLVFYLSGDDRNHFIPAVLSFLYKKSKHALHGEGK